MYLGLSHVGQNIFCNSIMFWAFRAGYLEQHFRRCGVSSVGASGTARGRTAILVPSISTELNRTFC